jgi:hypothetical protein
VNKLEYKFFKEDKVNWKRKLDQSVVIIERTLNGEYEDLVLTLSPFKRTKTTEQLRAIYKLFQLALPHFQEWMPNLVWDEELIKEFAKTELGYTRKPTGFEISMMIKASGYIPKDDADKAKMAKFCRRMKQNVSFADFTKEELYNFTREFEVWALSKGWEDVFLDDGEKRSLLGFNNKE